jgi:hypothetical protein
MPFSATEHERDGKRVVITETEWTHLYNQWIKKAIESYQPQKFRCFRSPAAPGNFIRGIVRDLYDSDIVIADLTGSKGNVYYELGIRHAMETGTIMITQDLASVPSDLRGYYTFPYQYTSEHHEYDHHYAEFEKQLHEKISYIFDNVNPSDNPVSDFLGQPNEYLRHAFEQEKDELVFLTGILSDVVSHNYNLCETLLKMAKPPHEMPEDGVALIFDFYPFDLLLSRIVNTRWQFIPMQTVQDLNQLLNQIRLLFLPVHQGWQILRINPTSEATAGFFELVEEVVGTRLKNEDELLDGLIAEAKKLDFKVTFTPRAEALRKKEQ